jgi:hypothetical protein
MGPCQELSRHGPRSGRRRQSNLRSGQDPRADSNARFDIPAQLADKDTVDSRWRRGRRRRCHRRWGCPRPGSGLGSNPACQRRGGGRPYLRSSRSRLAGATPPERVAESGTGLSRLSRYFRPAARRIVLAPDRSARAGRRVADLHGPFSTQDSSGLLRPPCPDGMILRNRGPRGPSNDGRRRNCMARPRS